ncbi:MAG: dATP/dGTP diphosphohydrolase domain-containing protein [Bryobacteraceae bacterium]
METRNFIIADSGTREEHATGAVRDIRQGKGRFDLITPVALRRLAKIYEGGAVKYAARNWEKGMPISRFLDSAKRHINDYETIALYKREGKPLSELPPDINPNEDHIAQATWNLFGVMHMEEIKPELDDVTRKEAA